MQQHGINLHLFKGLHGRQLIDRFPINRPISDYPFQGYVGYLGWDSGDPYGLIYGRDSWGNICNKQNDPIPDVNLSGRDTTGLKYVTYVGYLL